MSGHSHAANIAAKKAKTDAAKGKIFTKVGREIAVAAKSNPDPDTNSKLADAQDALTVLGYSRNEALKVLGTIDTASLELDDIIRLALKKLMK